MRATVYRKNAAGKIQAPVGMHNKLYIIVKIGDID
jgi:hypothetical protein